MPSKPTYEELQARVAALELALNFPGSPMVREVAGPPADIPPGKTFQQSRPQRVTVPTDLLAMLGTPTVDPVVLASQITQLRTIITSGVNSAGYGDKRTEFRSLNDLREILNGLEEDLAAALGGGGRIRQIRMTTQADKGL